MERNEKRIPKNILDKENIFLQKLGYQLVYDGNYGWLKLLDMEGQLLSFSYRGQMNMKRHGLPAEIKTSYIESSHIIKYSSFGKEWVVIEVGFNELTGAIEHLSFDYSPQNKKGYRAVNYYKFSFDIRKDKPSIGMQCYKIGSEARVLEATPIEWKLLEINNKKVTGEDIEIHVHNEKGSLFEICNQIPMNCKTFNVIADSSTYKIQEEIRAKGEEDAHQEASWNIKDLDKLTEDILQTTWTRTMFLEIFDFISRATPGIPFCFGEEFPEFKLLWDFIELSVPTKDALITDAMLEIDLDMAPTKKLASENKE